MKKLSCVVEYSSIFHDSKWLCEVRVGNFSSLKTTQNKKFLQSIGKAIEEYDCIEVGKKPEENEKIAELQNKLVSNLNYTFALEGKWLKLQEDYDKQKAELLELRKKVKEQNKELSKVNKIMEWAYNNEKHVMSIFNPIEGFTVSVIKK